MYDIGEIFDIYDIFDIGVNVVEYYIDGNDLQIKIK